jgi:Polyketide cyclase / dehydrase and lipid transport
VRPITSTIVVPQPPEAAFAFLADLRNHWRLERRFVALEGLDGDPDAPRGGLVRLVGPLRVSRLARTRVLEAAPPAEGRPGTLRGLAELGPTTRGRVRWDIVPRPDGGSVITLAAEVERASSLDRALLALGGRAWLQRIFDGSLLTLASLLADDEASGGRPG